MCVACHVPSADGHQTLSVRARGNRCAKTHWFDSNPLIACCRSTHRLHMLLGPASVPMRALDGIGTLQVVQTHLGSVPACVFAEIARVQAKSAACPDVPAIGVLSKRVPVSVGVPGCVVDLAAGAPLTTGAYAFLSTHNMVGCKMNAVVMYGSNPLLAVVLRNRGIGGDKAMGQSAPNWKLNLTLGPFLSLSICRKACREWVLGTRGVTSKQSKGFVLATRYYTPLYSLNKRPPGGMHNFLAVHGPPGMADCYARLRIDCAVSDTSAHPEGTDAGLTGGQKKT